MTARLLKKSNRIDRQSRSPCSQTRVESFPFDTIDLLNVYILHEVLQLPFIHFIAYKLLPLKKRERRKIQQKINLLRVSGNFQEKYCIVSRQLVDIPRNVPEIQRHVLECS